MNNAAKLSTALLSTHSSSSSENNNLEAAQETAQQLALLQHDSKEEDNNNELLEENNDETTKLSEYHAKNYFNSTMGRKDVWALFAMAIGCHMRNLPSHKDPPFSKSKVYHTEIKPDAATLKLEITRHWKAYHYSGRQPCPANWRIEKCIDFLMANPIPSSEEFDLDWLVTEMHEWKGIQEMIKKPTKGR